MKFLLLFPIIGLLFGMGSHKGHSPVNGQSKHSTEMDSISEWEKLIPKYPDSLQLHRAYIKAMGLENPILVAHYSDWAKAMPQSAGIPYGLGNAMASAYDYRAKDWLLKAVAIDPKLANAWLQLSFDSERWGDEALGSYYMGKAAEAEPDNPDYAFYYASGFKSVKPAEYEPRMLEVVKRFPQSERSAQALYWLANREKDTHRKKEFYERSKKEFPPQKFRWSSSSMGDYFALLLKEDPTAAVALSREMIAAVENTETWENNLAIAQQVNSANNYIRSGKGQEALDIILTKRTGRLYGIEETLALLTTDAWIAAGKPEQAYDSLMNYYAKAPSKASHAKLLTYGKKLGLSTDAVNTSISDKLRSLSEPATQFELEKYTEAEQLKLADLKGNAVLVTYWFPGCGPCRGEFPHFENVLQKFNRNEVSYIGINMSPKEDPYVLPFMASTGHTFIPVKDDPENRGNLPARGAPTNYLIDRNGNIVYKNFMIGANNEEMLELMLAHALAL